MSLTVMMLATPPTLDEAGIDKRPDEPVGYLKTHWMSEDRVAGKPEAPPSLTEAGIDKRPVDLVRYRKPRKMPASPRGEAQHPTDPIQQRSAASPISSSPVKPIASAMRSYN